METRETRETRETWAKRVERWKDSGRTAADFASEVGVSPRSLTWWRWRLAQESPQPAPPTQPPAPAPVRRRRRARSKSAAEAAVAPLTFVEVSAGVESHALEVVLPSSIRIRVRPEFDAATLGRLLDVLDQRR